MHLVVGVCMCVCSMPDHKQNKIEIKTNKIGIK